VSLVALREHNLSDTEIAHIFGTSRAPARPHAAQNDRDLQVAHPTSLDLPRLWRPHARRHRLRAKSAKSFGSRPSARCTKTVDSRGVSSERASLWIKCSGMSTCGSDGLSATTASLSTVNATTMDRLTSPSLRQARNVISSELIAGLLSVLEGESIAVMLYGSRARGDARPDSDFDVLQLVTNKPTSYSRGQVNISAYTVQHLTELAERGSLFARHLRKEGIVLLDKQLALTDALGAYREPNSYEPLRRNLQAITIALERCGGKYGPSAHKVAVYVLRTALYVECIEKGMETFDVVAGAVAINRAEVGRVLRDSRASTDELLGWCRTMLRADEADFQHMPKEFETAVLWCGSIMPMAGALLESVIVASATIDYASLTLPIA
jgi:predicted nucleotidyltransferase